MRSHSVTCHPAEVTFPPLPQPKLVLDLATPEGCKAELTWRTRNASLRETRRRKSSSCSRSKIHKQIAVRLFGSVFICFNGELRPLRIHLSRQIRKLTSVSRIFKENHVVRVETDGLSKRVFRKEIRREIHDAHVSMMRAFRKPSRWFRALYRRLWAESVDYCQSRSRPVDPGESRRADIDRTAVGTLRNSPRSCSAMDLSIIRDTLWSSYHTDCVGGVFRTIFIPCAHSVSTGGGQRRFWKSTGIFLFLHLTAWNFAHP